MSCKAISMGLMVALSFAPVDPARADGPAASPRYSLAPGREFSYRSESRSDKSDGRTYLVDWKAWAIGREPDGSWRMVIRSDLRTREANAPNPTERERATTLVWRCRLFDDGRLVDGKTMGTVRDPYRLFPRLPAGADGRAGGWDSSGPEAEGVIRRHRLAGSGDSTLEIASKSEGPEDRVYVSAHEYRATFDAKRGVVTRVETEDTSGYPRPGTTRGTIELVAVEDRGERWAADFGAEAARYFDAADAYEAATMRAAREADRCPEILAGARRDLEAVKAALATPVFLDSIGQMIADHDRGLNYQIKQAREYADRLGKAAAGWEAKDVDGKTHRLADYRGKVVVMDFWYRGCGWCMHAMPQLIRVSETFRDAPVVVLGMSTDRDEKDARVVIDAMKLEYPTIMAGEVPEKYGINAYPTLVVVDQQGVVREIHVGYSPRLYEDLSTLIRGLLDPKPAG